MTRIGLKTAILMSISLLLAVQSINAEDSPYRGITKDSRASMGQLSTAEVVPPGAIDLGAYAGFFEDLNGLIGVFRMGLFDRTDWEVKSGLMDTQTGSDPQFMIGTSMKFHFLKRTENQMPDMALTAGLEFYELDAAGASGSSFGFTGGLIGSFPIWLAESHRLTPYGRLSTRIERNDVGRWEDTDFDIGLNLGAQYAPRQNIHFYGEFQLDAQIGFITGVNFAVY